jgi:hypothetical protein
MPVILATWETEIRRIEVPGQQVTKPYLQNNQSKKWTEGVGPSGKVLALQVGSPEFKSQSDPTPKNTKENAG